MYKIPATTLFLGKNLIFVPECHSTNDLALLMCQKPNLIEGSLIITTHQTAGRGQRGNSWQAEPGKNLTFSFILRPAFLNMKDQFFLNLFTSLGIYDYLTAQRIQKVQIKWPNDVLVDKKKIAGILIENQIAGKQIENTIIGIGLNVNQRQFTLHTPTSLKVITGSDYVLSDQLDFLLKFLECRYFQLKEGKLDLLLHDYLHNLYLFNQPHDFTSRGEQFEGVITGIDSTGRLQIKVKSETRVFDVKEIQYM